MSCLGTYLDLPPRALGLHIVGMGIYIGNKKLPTSIIVPSTEPQRISTFHLQSNISTPPAQLRLPPQAPPTVLER